MAERSLYHTYVRNENGLVGESYVGSASTGVEE